jgi:hypothetical protein
VIPLPQGSRPLVREPSMYRAKQTICVLRLYSAEQNKITQKEMSKELFPTQSIPAWLPKAHLLNLPSYHQVVQYCV